MSWLVLAATPLDKFSEWVQKEAEKFTGARAIYEKPRLTNTQMQELLREHKPEFTTFEWDPKNWSLGPLHVDFAAVESKLKELGVEGPDARRALKGFGIWIKEVYPEAIPHVIHKGIPETGKGSPEFVQQEVAEGVAEPVAPKSLTHSEERRRTREEKRRALVEQVRNRYRDIRKEEPHVSQEYQEHMRRLFDLPPGLEIPVDPEQLSKLVQEKGGYSARRRPGAEEGEEESARSVDPAELSELEREQLEKKKGPVGEREERLRKQREGLE